MRILSLLILLLLILIGKQQTKSPHGQDFKVSCSECHSSKGWFLDREIYSFNHNATSLPLTGQHTTVDCKTCHTSLVFSEAKTECNECHKDIHQSTTGQDCGRCHTPESWLVKDITGIHRRSRFPLLGAHRMAACIDCHKSESLARYDVSGVNCIDCHRQEYHSTTSPNHMQAGFSEDCSTCHPLNSMQWTGAGFNHNFFALVESHSGLKCDDCHKTLKYSDATPDCASCHKPDYLATKNPGHTASGFPLTCENCHTLAPGWKPASFNHTGFPLTLGHAAVDCSACHKSGNFANTPTDCYACHQADYNNTTNPKHPALSFTTSCTTCHTTEPGWKPAKYPQHDAQSFPIYTGRHKGTWSDCSQCHTNPSNYSVFTCTSCHEHNKTSMDRAHSDVRNYSYNSTSCFTCHPTGRAE